MSRARPRIAARWRRGCRQSRARSRSCAGSTRRGSAPIVSSSRTHWIATHLEHLGIRDAFPLIFSGREHVARGKPAPDLYLHAAQALGVDIRRCVILEDSPVGVTGAVASGAHVIGLCAGQHCAADHADRLRALGVHDIAYGFDAVARLIA